MWKSDKNQVKMSKASETFQENAEIRSGGKRESEKADPISDY